MSTQHTVRSSRRSAGVTLVELLVALAIGLFMTLAVVGVYAASKGAFRYTDAVSRVQENARFATELLARNIRMAGYMGCGSLSQFANVVNGGGSSLFLDLSTPVRGYEGGVSAFPSEFSTAVAGTDAIVLLGIDPSTEFSVVDHNPAAAQINTGNHTIPKGSLLLITDCAHTALFQMTGPATTGVKTNVVHNTGVSGVSPGNCNKELGASCPTAKSYQFKPGASLLRLSANGFYIAPSASGNGNALWMRSIDQTGGSGTTVPQELLQGVENMQIEYGVDDDGDKAANQWQRADDVSNWSNVVAVRVSLLLYTLENNLSSVAQVYSYDGDDSIEATDRRVRRVYSTTTAIRNRTQ